MKKNKALQALRLVFVMMIFMSHYDYGGCQPFDAGGDCGVAFFFLLSGFTMSMGYGRSLTDGTFGWKRYLTRRLWRIYPLHVMCLVLVLVLFRPAIDVKLPLNALLLQAWIPDAAYYFSYNGVSWFLSALLFCYLLFPLAYRKGNSWVLAVVLVACAVVYVLVPYEQVNALLYVAPWIRCADFFLGIMLYKLYDNWQNVHVGRWAEWLTVAVLLAALWAYPYVDAKVRNAPLYWLVLLPMIFVFARQEGLLSQLLQHRVLQGLAQLSMPIFLLHPIVFRAMFHLFPTLSAGTMLALCVVVVLGISWVADRVVSTIR